MTELERDLEEVMQRLAHEASMPWSAGGAVLARSRRRRIAVPIVASFVVVLAAGAALAGANALRDDAQIAPVATPTEETYDNPGPYELGDDPSTGRTEIATGERDGLQWLMYATREGEKGLCTGVEWNGDAEGCGSRGNDHAMSIGMTTSDGPEWMVYGDVAYEVADVEVRLEDQEPFRVPILPDPGGFGADFVAFFVPSEARGEVVALAEDGSVLETQSLTVLTDSMQQLMEDISEDEADQADDKNRCMDSSATIIGTPGDDVLEGTPGQDVIMGLDGNDVITGLGEIDFICGGAGDDQIDGGEDDDEIWGGPGADALSGGPGFDTVAYWQADSAVTVDLAQGTATGEGSDSLSGFEGLGGSKHDDILHGTEGEDQIDGFDGDDQIHGLGGDDIINGDLYEPGNDMVDGGEGKDFYGFNSSKTAVVVDLSAGTASGQGDDLLASIEIVHGTEFSDTLIGSDADESISGLEGDDTIDGGAGDDELWGEFPHYTAEDYRFESSYLELKDDRIDGGPGDDWIVGGPGENNCSNGERVEDC